MRNLKERGYGSTEHFVSVNGLEKEAESLFGKGWESVNDREEIEKLITLIGADFYEVEIYENSGYYFHVVFNEDLERVSELEEQNKKLIERLNANHSAIDSATDGLLELYGNGYKDTDVYLKLVGQLAENEELLEDFHHEIGIVKDYRFGLISYEVERLNDDLFVINDTSDGWASAEISKNIMKGIIKGKYSLEQLNFN